MAAESWNLIALRVGRRCGRLTSNNRRANCGLSSVCRAGDAVGYAHRSCVAPGKLLAGRWTQMFSFPMKRVVISRRTRRHCNASSGSAPAQRSPRHQTVGRPHVLRAASSRYICLGRRGLPCPQVASRPLAATIAARSAVFLQSLIACNPTPTVCVPLVTPPWRNIVMSVSACVSLCQLSVSPRAYAYLRNYTSDLHQLCCTYYLWPWLSSSVLHWRRCDILPVL